MVKKVSLHLHQQLLVKMAFEDVFELKLTEEELALFKKSCAVIREYAHKAESL